MGRDIIDLSQRPFSNDNYPVIDPARRRVNPRCSGDGQGDKIPAVAGMTKICSFMFLIAG